MLPELTKIKGVHPGAILRRELKKQGIRASHLADAMDEHKQTISAILNKKRDINPKLSIKLAKQFDVDPDYFLLLQASYEVKTLLSSEFKQTPNLKNIRSILFWETTLDKIDWIKNRRAIIQRILERGNSTEIEEIISFYGKKVIAEEIKFIGKSRLPSFHKNIVEHNLK